MRAIVKFGIPARVPFENDIAIAKVAAKCEINPQALKRILSYCKTNGVFRETRPGYIGHTAASAALARGDLGSAMRWSVDIPALSGLKMFDAMKLFNACDSPRECPFNIAYMTEETMFEYQERHPQMAALFSDNMKTESGATRLSPKHAALGFDWSKIGGGTVVDVGVKLCSSVAVLTRCYNTDGRFQRPREHGYCQSLSSFEFYCSRPHR